MSVIASEDIVGDAAFVADLARRHSESLAAGDHLPAELVSAARAAGLFRMCLVSELGGLGVPLSTAMAVIEDLAHADGSLAWCVAVANVTAWRLATIDEAEARVVAAEPDKLIIAGSFPPHGRGRRVGDGYEMSVHSTFASGSMAATWFVCGMLAEEADGAVRPLVAYFPAAQGRIVRNWDVIGLRATGSHDVVADNVTVPAGRTTTMTGGQSWSADPVAAVSFLGIAALIAAVPLGVAAHALAELVTVAEGKTPFGQSAPLIEDPAFQGRYAAALGRLSAARGYLLDRAEAVWQQARDKGGADEETRADLVLAVGEAGAAALAATQFAHQAVGTTSIRTDSTLNRCLDDVVVATRHIAFSQAAGQIAGRVRMGRPADSPFFEA